MAFQVPITIHQAINHIRKEEYVLPAIQREFVWNEYQIANLFDSLMRGYPIGSFLFWRVDKYHCNLYTFYRFLDNYHQRDQRHNTRIDLRGDESTIAILDGQQRLTSLYIGLKGSYAYKLPRLWWNNPDAFPVRRLYLNLLQPAADKGVGLAYDFRFLTERDAPDSPGFHWFPVGKVLGFNSLRDINGYLRENDLIGPEYPEQCLFGLYEAICVEKMIHFYQEEEQDLDKVLNIFIRMNSAGTPLSYSDLLLSIATSQWTKRDARQVIHDLVDELNRIGAGFNLNKDFVLKSCLVLADISNIGFTVTNFTRENSEKIESAWQEIADALRLAVQLLSRFGYNRHTLRANNALIPIAYYLYKKHMDQAYLTSDHFAGDRASVHKWITRALLKTGTFGAGVDTTLQTARKTIQDSYSSTFPEQELYASFARIGRGLRFEEEELEDLLDQSYGSSLTYSVLSLLYPGVDVSYQFHEDHIFPYKLFTRKPLIDAGVSEDEVDDFLDCCNRIANLQLLEGSQNLEKAAKMPADWLRDHFTNEDSLLEWKRRNFIEHNIPESITGFFDFYETRRANMKKRLAEILGVSLTS